jgi:hypothetical protein
MFIEVGSCQESTSSQICDYQAVIAGNKTNLARYLANTKSVQLLATPRALLLIYICTVKKAKLDFKIQIVQYQCY